MVSPCIDATATPPRTVTALEALLISGSLTGRDPRSLGENEGPGYELGLSRPRDQGVKALRQMASDPLADPRAMTGAPLVLSPLVNPDRCVPASRR